jgi:hypothetical protein
VWSIDRLLPLAVASIPALDRLGGRAQQRVVPKHKRLLQVRRGPLVQALPQTPRAWDASPQPRPLGLRRRRAAAAVQQPSDRVPDLPEGPQLGFAARQSRRVARGAAVRWWRTHRGRCSNSSATRRSLAWARRCSRHVVVAPEVPARGAKRQAVFHDQADGQGDDPLGVRAPCRRHIGGVGVEEDAAGVTAVRGGDHDQVPRAIASPATQVVEPSPTVAVAITTAPTAWPRTPSVVA